MSLEGSSPNGCTRLLSKPKREFTESEIETMVVLAASGIPYRIIAKALKTSESELSSRFKDVLADAREQANGAVAETLFKMATSGRQPAATFFWMKTRAGWKETNVIEHSGQIETGIDLSKATDEELAVIRRVVMRSAKSGSD